MPRYISFPFLTFLFCFILTSMLLMLCVYLQTFEAELFLEEEECINVYEKGKKSQIN